MKVSNSSSENIEWNVHEMIVPWHGSDLAGVPFHGNYLFLLERDFLSALSDRGYEIGSRRSIHSIGFQLPWLNIATRRQLRSGAE